MTRDEFYGNIIKPLVDDSLEFIQQNYNKFQPGGTPPTEWRYLHVFSHRQVGHTYAAIKLLYDYSPSIIVVPTYGIKRHTCQSPNNPLIDDKQVLVPDDVIMKNRVHVPYLLGVVDLGSRIKNREQVLDRLFLMCTLVVEFF